MAFPIAVPPSSQNRSRLLSPSRFCRISRTSAEPPRAIFARSDVTSFTGSTGSICFVKTVLPSRNGGRVSCTRSVMRASCGAGGRAGSAGATHADALTHAEL